MTDVFAMQDEIAQAITTALKGRLAAPGGRRQYTPRLPAYETFLQGRAHLMQFTPDAWNRAKGLSSRRSRSIRLRRSARRARARAISSAACTACCRCGRSRRSSGRRSSARWSSIRRIRGRGFCWAPSRWPTTTTGRRPRRISTRRWARQTCRPRAVDLRQPLSSRARPIRGIGGRDGARGRAGSAERHVACDLGAHLIDAGRFDQAIDAALRATELEPELFRGTATAGRGVLGGRQVERGDGGVRTRVSTGALECRRDGMARRRALAARREGACHACSSWRWEITPQPLWGRVVYHLHTSDLDAAADWYRRMIEQRDPFALVYARASITAPLREHHRWPELAALMKLPAGRSQCW